MKTLWIVTAAHVMQSVHDLAAKGITVDVIVPTWIVPDQLDFADLEVYLSHSSDDLLLVIEQCLQKTCYDHFVPSWPDHLTDQVVALCKKYMVQSIQQEAANAISNKLSYYNIWSILGIPVPEIYSGSIQYPCIVKPSWGTAGIGIKIIENAEELADFFTNDVQHQPLDSDYIIQQYVQGTVCSVMGSIKNKKCQIDMCYDIHSSAWPYVAETELRYPSQHVDVAPTIKKLIEKFARYIGLDNTVFMLDFIVDQDHDIYFLDFGARLSVNGQLLMYHSGEQQYLSKLINNQPADPKHAVLVKDLGLAPGTIQTISCEQSSLAVKLVLPKHVSVACQDDCFYHNGYAIITGADLTEADSTYNSLINSIAVSYKQSEDITC
jgi:hypothetical protein